ncbi:MAG: hypothetical protein R3316_03685 [Rhodovibrionaceae bacterium]|nr:hypothetical protein [Rhodovibrionaceae bacterium]
MTALLGACASGFEGGTFVRQPFFSSYDNSMLRYTAGRGGMLVQTIGNPFEAPPREVSRIVAGHMEGAQFGPRMPFFSTPPEGFGSIYRMRVSLNTTMTAQAICRRESTAQKTAPSRQRGAQRVDVVMAFCSGEKRISSVRGYATGVNGPRDPKFRSLLRIMTKVILPQRDPHRIGNGHGEDFDR